jgi:hypothetical protein
VLPAGERRRAQPPGLLEAFIERSTAALNGHGSHLSGFGYWIQYRTQSARVRGCHPDLSTVRPP